MPLAMALLPSQSWVTLQAGEAWLDFPSLPGASKLRPSSSWAVLGALLGVESFGVFITRVCCSVQKSWPAGGWMGLWCFRLPFEQQELL